MTRPRISVCMATYNGERFIEEQLKSILLQLNDDDEVIISDDSSTDCTVNIIKSFNDKRVRLFENQKFHNHLFNFEHALIQSKNSFIFLADQDDVWVEGRVDIMLQALQTFDMVVCDHKVINEDGDVIENSYFLKFPFRAKPGVLRNLFRHSYSGCCMAFNRGLLKKALPFPKGVGYHDYWLGFIANLCFKVKFVDVPLTLYRRHSRNITFGSTQKSKNSLLTRLKIRINVIKYLPLLLFRLVNGYNKDF